MPPCLAAGEAAQQWYNTLKDILGLSRRPAPHQRQQGLGGEGETIRCRLWSLAARARRFSAEERILKAARA